MNMLDKAEAMKDRTKRSAIRIVTVCRSLPSSGEGNVLANQLLRSGTAVAANHRAVCRARSKAEFVSKMSIVVEEADETVFWQENAGRHGDRAVWQINIAAKGSQRIVGDLRCFATHGEVQSASLMS